MIPHLALIQEIVAEELPERPAIVWRGRTRTFADLTARTRRLANAFLRLGLGSHSERERLANWESGHDHVALYLYNCPEYMECMYGAFKARATAFNVNYRYTKEEIVHLLRDAGARALVFGGAFAETVAALRAELPGVRHLVQVDDDSEAPLLPGALAYEALLAAERPELPALPFSPDDLYVLYTGGTTGMPKGVLWRQEDAFYNSLGGHLPGFPRLETEAQLREHVNLGIGGTTIVCLPFMHGAAQWTTFNAFHRGGTIVLPHETRRMDAHGIWRAVVEHRAEQLPIVGDAFARPLIAAQREGRYDLGSLRLVVSTAAVLSRSVREELLAVLPDGVMVLETIGGSELGIQAMGTDTESGQAGIPAYQLREGTVLLNAARTAVLAPGSDETGWIASTGHLPLGYLGDAAKTQATFPVIDGVRHVVGGDRGRYLPDGRVLFLGREAVCINTGGEKVYVEEVERVVKSHAAVYDALVVGVPNPRWGQQVTAVVALRPGATAPAAEALRAHCAPFLADYKIPKAVVVAPEIVRSPSGKPDYEWAKRHAAAALGVGASPGPAPTPHATT
jgi:fatty-acyl-CoA synthase